MGKTLNYKLIDHFISTMNISSDFKLVSSLSHYSKITERGTTEMCIFGIKSKVGIQFVKEQYEIRKIFRVHPDCIYKETIICLTRAVHDIMTSAVQNGGGEM